MCTLSQAAPPASGNDVLLDLNLALRAVYTNHPPFPIIFSLFSLVSNPAEHAGYVPQGVMSISPLIGLLAAIPIVALLTPLLGLLLLRIWGKFLQASSSDRRHVICTHVKEELNAAKAESRRKSQEIDDEWEKVESSASAPNGEVPKDNDWAGIVGFFHPFWQVSFGLCCKVNVLMPI